ncbi:uncharacterized protein LOC144910149 [Branchiostoma floridae x Branchiostoma belcheri]
MAQGYKSGGPGDGNYWGSDPNRTRGSTVQGFKQVPSAPYNLRCEAKSYQEATVSWELPTGKEISSINLQLFKDQGYGSWSKVKEDSFESTTRSVTVTTSGPLEKYALQVRADNRFGHGDPESIKLG